MCNPNKTSAKRPFSARFGLWAAAFSLTLAACSSNTGLVYKPDTIQGNLISQQQVLALKKGMNPQQVREVLGTPLIVDPFQKDRWEYAFTIDRQGVPVQRRKMTVFFNNGAFDRVEGDAMLTDEEYVAQIDKRSKPGKAPKLAMTQAELDALPKPRVEAAPSASPPATPSATQAAPARNYPPLEPR